MTKIRKITLSPSRDIAFNKLVLSQSNVRRVKAGVSIEQLAESIAQRTLLQSLNVRAVMDGDGNEFLFLRQSMFGSFALLKPSSACSFCNSHQISSPHQSYREAAVSIMGRWGMSEDATTRRAGCASRSC